MNVSRHTIDRRYWIFGLLLWVAGLVLASPWDLEISVALADRSDPVATAIQNFGTFPSGLFYLAAIVFLMVPGWRRRSQTLQVAAVILLLASLLQPLVITTTLKFLWGRVRFGDLAPGFTDYTPFYQPNTPGAGQSFPSGHVATACVFFPLAVWYWWQARRRLALFIAAATALWGAFTAWARIRYGAHHLTDTLFSAGLAILLAPLVARLGFLTWHRFFREPDTTID